MGEGAERILHNELKLVRVESLKHVQGGSRSPVVFAHGYPDSPLMFKEYYSAKEQKNEWLRQRSIYTIAFPNRHTNRVMPSLMDLIRRRVYLEFHRALKRLMEESPTGKLVLVAHDWGSTYDVKEHGLRAFQWLYSSILCLAYYFPFYPVHWLLWKMLAVAAGYKARNAPNAYDAWHYWFGPLEILRAPIDLIGLTYTKEFKGYRFPVLYIRHRSADRIATTAEFEKDLAKRKHCQLFVVDFEEQHFFPENRPAEILTLIRAFFNRLNTSKAARTIDKQVSLS